MLNEKQVVHRLAEAAALLGSAKEALCAAGLNIGPGDSIAAAELRAKVRALAVTAERSEQDAHDILVGSVEEIRRYRAERMQAVNTGSPPRGPSDTKR